MDVEACYYDGIQDVEDYLACINISVICVNQVVGRIGHIWLQFIHLLVIYIQMEESKLLIMK